MRRFLKILENKEVGISFVLIIIIAFISSKSDVFLRIDNTVDLLKGNIVISIIALGMLMVIITGGIDVSVGAMTAAVTVIIGQFMVNFSSNLFTVILVACLSGTFLGMINGIIITKFEIPPIVATLGMLSIINGLMLFFTNGNWINDLPEWFIEFGKISLFEFEIESGIVVGIPIQLLFLIFSIALTWFILKKTTLGRGIYALGGNKESAIRVGYNIDKIQIFLYSYVGFLVGIAGLVHTSIMKQVDPNAFNGFEMAVIAAVVLGGANILGGFGTVLGTLIGVSLLAVINNGLILLHISSFWQKVVIGIVMLIALTIDVLKDKWDKNKRVRVEVEN